MNRRQARALLAAQGTSPSRLRIRDALTEALTNVTRAPSRTILTSLGTALAVGTAIATVGLSESAGGAVSNTFQQLQATVVTFTDNRPAEHPAALTESSERALDRLHGVISSGLIWSVDGGQQLNVSRVAVPEPENQASADLAVTVASPRALATVGAVASVGRLYDEGMDHRRDRVALLSQSAAAALGITSVDLSPTIYISGARLTAIGIIRSGLLESQMMQGVIIPPGAAAAIPKQGPPTSPTRQIIVRTTPGAAQLIGRQGPYAIDPYQPGRVGAQVPIDPTRLRNQVSQQLTVLLLAVAIVTLVVGLISITNITLLSVIQRRPEIGLRRSVGAAPRHIAVLIVGEAALIGVIGGLLGTSGGVFITALVSASRGWAPTLAPIFIGAAPLVGGATGALAGLYPAWRASRVSPISALQRG